MIKLRVGKSTAFGYRANEVSSVKRITLPEPPLLMKYFGNKYMKRNFPGFPLAIAVLSYAFPGLAQACLEKTSDYFSSGTYLT